MISGAHEGTYGFDEVLELRRYTDEKLAERQKLQESMSGALLEDTIRTTQKPEDSTWQSKTSVENKIAEIDAVLKLTINKISRKYQEKFESDFKTAYDIHSQHDTNINHTTSRYDFNAIKSSRARFQT